MDKPSFTVWKIAGSPDLLPRYKNYVASGQCSLCGVTGNCVPIKRVASFLFTNWDDYSNEDKPLWCNPCIWSFIEKDNRSEAIFIKDANVYSSYQLQSMKTLFDKPFNEFTSASVALKKNKHVLPYSQWGSIRIEDISFAWTQREVEWMHNISRLTKLGFTIGDIKKDDSPSFIPLMKLNKMEALEAYDLWNKIKGLRYLPHIFVFILELHKTASMEYSTRK